jgi:Cu(I)/Ag(I) efflux system membrane fusion protein
MNTMKIKSMFYSLLLSAAVVTFFANCSGNKKEDDHTGHEDHAGKDTTEHASGSTAAAEAAEPQFQVDASFQNQLASVFTSYVELKDAFVASDAGKVKDEAKQTDEALAKVDMKLLSGAAHNDWMNYLSPIQSSLKEIQAAADIEAQRKAFSNLSDNLYKSVKAFGLGGKEAFYEFCPMAFNNEGAYWLSDQEQIKNPYFGDKMLTCGSVKEKLK